MGIVLAAVLYPIVNQTLWRELDDRPALEWKSFGRLITIIAILDLLILTEHPAHSLPSSILSALGVLSLLVIVFGILWITIMKADNTYENAGQLWLPIVCRPDPQPAAHPRH